MSEPAGHATTKAAPKATTFGPDLPLCGREEFDKEMEELAFSEAPALFAVMQEYGDRVDGRVAAWGMAFEDHAEIVSVEGHRRMNVVSLKRAVKRFAQKPDISARLVWMWRPEGQVQA